eukprot:486978-Pyramimonas_sp.AAC.1
MAQGRHANPDTGAFGGAPDGATKRVRGAQTWGNTDMPNLALRHSVAPPQTTIRARGVPKWRVEPHANAATGAFDGVPCGATKR